LKHDGSTSVVFNRRSAKGLLRNSIKKW